MQTGRFLILLAAVVSALIGDACAGNEIQEAAHKWMRFLPGTWAFENVENEVSGSFVVTKSELNHVLSVRAINKEGRVYVVSTYVWDEMSRTLKLLGGYRSSGREGAFLVTFNSFADDTLSGKDDNGESVGYKKIDENEWHVTDKAGRATIKLKRKRAGASTEGTAVPSD